MEASLIYIASFRPARIIQLDPVSEKANKSRLCDAERDRCSSMGDRCPSMADPHPAWSKAI